MFNVHKTQWEKVVSWIKGEFGSAFWKSVQWKSGVLLKVHNEKVEFQKAECLVKTVKKCIMKKLRVWLALIKVAV